MQKSKKYEMNILTKVRNIRTKNNKLWMDLLALAMECAPDKARNIIKKITENDKKISQTLEDL